MEGGILQRILFTLRRSQGAFADFFHEWCHDLDEGEYGSDDVSGRLTFRVEISVPFLCHVLESFIVLGRHHQFVSDNLVASIRLLENDVSPISYL